MSLCCTYIHSEKKADKKGVNEEKVYVLSDTAFMQCVVSLILPPLKMYSLFSLSQRELMHFLL